MKKYYVYAWFNDETGEIFYIGKGKGRRYRETKDRNPKFIAYVNKYKCSSEIIYGNLDENTAYQKEKDLIALYRTQGMASCNFHDGGDRPPLRSGHEHPNRRQVIQLSLDGKFIKQWGCISDIEKAFNGSNSLITRVCKGKSPSAYGYLWVYLEDYNPTNKYEYSPRTVAKKIEQYTLTDELVKVWDSAMEVEKELGFRRSGISGCLKGTYKSSHGFKWKYNSVG